MSGDNLTRAKEVGWRQALTQVLADKFGNGDTDGGMWVSWIAKDGYRSSGAASAKDAIAAIAPIITELFEDQGRAAYQRGREDAARDIEVNQGDRCPDCGGKPASTKWTRGRFEKVGRCGGGHTWTVKGKDWRAPAEVARGQRPAGEQR